MIASLTAAADASHRPAEREPPAISVAGLAKRYGNAWALRGIDLEVGRGERVLIMGENGSGKSTLLRLLGMVSRPSRGAVLLCGHDPASDAAALRRHITLLADRPSFYPALTPSENLELSCTLHGRALSPEAILAALESVGIGAAAHVPTHTLSRGMTQRLALAGASLRPSPIMLLDEPYTALDAGGIAWVDRWLDELRAADATVLVATHVLTPRARVGARVETLRAGVIDRDTGEGRAQRASARPAAQKVELESGDERNLHRALAIARKDLRIERRAGAVLGGMVCFAAVVLLLFGFALGPGAALREACAGLGWVTVLLAAVLMLDRSSQIESEHGGWDALRLVPGARWPIYAGKVAAATLLLLIVELALLPCAIVLYNLDVPPPAAWLQLAAVAALATFGMVAIGMLYALLTANIRARQVLIPLLLFPMMIPVLLAAVKTTGLLLFGDPMHELTSWTKLLAAADLVYVTVGVSTFGILLDE